MFFRDIKIYFAWIMIYNLMHLKHSLFIRCIPPMPSMSIGLQQPAKSRTILLCIKTDS